MPTQPTDSYSEHKRLDALHSLALLEPGREDRFDPFARILSNALKTPIAFVGFMEADRQVLTASQGLEQLETPRDQTFCTHALDQGFLVVSDATQDPVFANKPGVIGKEHIRFYAGSVIKDPDGYPLGTLCALDREPRSLSDSEKQLMQDLTKLVESEIAVQQRTEASKRYLLENTFHDPVTGMAREALARTALGELIQDAIDSENLLAVAMIHFPRYDELVGTYGQEVADQAAQELAGRMRRVTRSDGLAARLRARSFHPRTTRSVDY